MIVMCDRGGHRAGLEIETRHERLADIAILAIPFHLRDQQQILIHIRLDDAIPDGKHTLLGKGDRNPLQGPHP